MELTLLVAGVMALGLIYGGLFEQEVCELHRWLERKAAREVQPEEDWSLWSPAKLRWMRRHYGFRTPRPPAPKKPPRLTASVSRAYVNHYGDLTVDAYYSR